MLPINRWYNCIVVLITVLILACKPTLEAPIVDPVPPVVPTQSDTTFIKGADISWVTEMESKGIQFYNKNGVATECFALMKEIGMNAIRIRVWVNPANKWNGIEDVLSLIHI